MTQVGLGRREARGGDPRHVAREGGECPFSGVCSDPRQLEQLERNPGIQRRLLDGRLAPSSAGHPTPAELIKELIHDPPLAFAAAVADLSQSPFSSRTRSRASKSPEAKPPRSRPGLPAVPAGPCQEGRPDHMTAPLPAGPILAPR